jgi:S-DNA-T family DNA segregation ATPase FtsK/SpoIIIE
MQSPSATPSTPPTRRDLQRNALHDLVALATECAANETEIEKRYTSAQETSKKEYQLANWDLNERFKALRDQFVREAEQQVRRVDSQYKQQLAAIKQADETERHKIELNFKAVERDVKRKAQDAMWEAESVFDATQIQIREVNKETKEKVGGYLSSLNELEDQVRSLLSVYNRPEPQVEAEQQPDLAGQDAEAVYTTKRDEAAANLGVMRALRVPKFFVNSRAFLLVFFVTILAAGVAWGAIGAPTSFERWHPLAISGGVALVAMSALMIFLNVVRKRQIRESYVPLRHALDAARHAAEAHLKNVVKAQEERYNEAVEKRKSEEKLAKDHATPLLAAATKRREAAIAAAQAKLDHKLPLLNQQRDAAKAEAEKKQREGLADLQQRYDRDTQHLKERHEKHLAEAKAKYDEATTALERRLAEGLATIQAPIANQADAALLLDWNDPAWKNWTPPKVFPSTIRFGKLDVDLKLFADAVPRATPLQLKLPPTFSVPANLEFPRNASLLIQTDREGRNDAIRVVQMVMARLLTALPAGRVRFNLIDPVGLGQNFAGFMHLADHDEALVGGRILTGVEDINQRMEDLTDHMETVIQKYLRNEYETIDQYNEQAGELAEPYRFLVVADFPNGFEAESLKRLSSIATTGSRCGVYVIVIHDNWLDVTSPHLEDLETHAVNIVREEGKFVWKDPVFEQFPLTLDPPPEEEFLTGILDVVGRHAREAKRVEVNFDTIAPHDGEFWSRSTSGDLQVPIGRMGATRLQYLKLGRGMAQHVLIAGKTGSGKSTLLHALVTNLAMWYSPDEIEFYLIDFKKGVEFKTYATHNLPHARAIAVESDREFGLSVLQRLDGELTRRGDIFRRLGVQDLPSFREVAKDDPTLPALPRTLLIIDEFQEFFSEDDKLAADAGLLLDRLVRQGRAFGIHVLLGSQTIGGTSGLARSTIGQMAVRVALQTSEADSQIILGDGNSAARLLTRPGEAIYNDAGGLVEANSPFQIAWLPDPQREGYLEAVQNQFSTKTLRGNHPSPIIFEGNAPADIYKNTRLIHFLENPDYTTAPATLAYIGDPVAIKDPTAIVFRRQAGSNVMIIGQQEEAALAMLCTAMVSIAAQQSPARAKFVVCDGTPADSPLATVLPSVKAVLPHEVKMVEYRAVGDAIAEIAEELSRRQATEMPDAPSIYVIIYGLQRYRALRKSEDSSFGFSMSGDEEKKPQADKQLADILREGPGLGIHVLAWCDTPASVERTFDRAMMREFDNRILFQMSANDSSNLIDSPTANKLGFHRALAFSEEQGVLEKFRPYALPKKEWLEEVREKLGARPNPTPTAAEQGPPEPAAAPEVGQ